MQRGTGESLVGALAKLEKAVEQEPDFALAHVALADTCQRLYQNENYYDVDRIEESRARMRPHLEKALAIIENLRQQHPGNPTVIWLEGDWLLQAGRVAEAIPLLEQATVADPDTFCSAVISSSPGFPWERRGAPWNRTTR